MQSQSSENRESAFKRLEYDKYAILRESLIPAVVFQNDSQDINVSENADADRQATVEGGIFVGKESPGDFLLGREMKVKTKGHKYHG